MKDDVGTAHNQHALRNMSYKFDVHGSVHHGNVYVQLEVQPDVHVFICILYSSIFSSKCFGCYLYPSSGAQTTAYSHRCMQSVEGRGYTYIVLSGVELYFLHELVGMCVLIIQSYGFLT
jgi:hypothetical protein